MASKSKVESKSSAVSSYREKGSFVSKKDPAANNFSFNWVILSVFSYLGVQVGLGMLARTFVYPNAGAKHTNFLAEGLVILMGFYLGAFLIGIISPGRRTFEPILGAFLAVLAVFSVSNFTPQMGGWLRFDGVSGMFVSGVIAAVMSGIGVFSAEKLMGNVKE